MSLFLKWDEPSKTQGAFIRFMEFVNTWGAFRPEEKTIYDTLWRDCEAALDALGKLESERESSQTRAALAGRIAESGAAKFREYEQLSSMCAELRDAFIDAVPEYGDERLNEMVGGPEYVLGYVIEYFRQIGT